MPKSTKKITGKKPKKQANQFKFFKTPFGYLIKAIIFALVGFWVFLLATDSGNLLEWGIVIVCLGGFVQQVYNSTRSIFIGIWKT